MKLSFLISTLQFAEFLACVASMAGRISNPKQQRAGPNHSLKLSTNGVSRWSLGAGPAAQFAPIAQRATPLAPA